jgi:hypothetical protein
VLVAFGADTVTTCPAVVATAPAGLDGPTASAPDQRQRTGYGDGHNALPHRIPLASP